MESNEQKFSGKKLSSVFTYSLILTAIVVLLGAIFPNQFNTIGTNITGWITEYFGWYYMIIVALMIFFCVFLIFSPIGKLKLGKPNDKPITIITLNKIKYHIVTNDWDFLYVQ